MKGFFKTLLTAAIIFLCGCESLFFYPVKEQINDPAKLHLLIQMIDSENGSRLDVDLKGEVYEGCRPQVQNAERSGTGLIPFGVRLPAT